jgi:membrane fusion protein, heavy metal efflux system
MTFSAPLLRAVVLAIAVLGGAAAAHEGQDHGDESMAQVIAGSVPRLATASGPFELVAFLRNGELVIYLDRFETNVPITGAAITIETPVGPVAASAGEGAYRLPAPWATAGSHDLIFTVTADDLTEVLTGTLSIAPEALAVSKSGSWSLPAPGFAQRLKDSFATSGAVLAALVAFVAGLFAARLLRLRGHAFFVLLAACVMLSPNSFPEAHEGHDHNPAEGAAQTGGEVAVRLPDGALFVPKPVQRILAIRTALAQVAIHRKALELPGRIIPDPNASGFAQASVSGRLSPPEGGFPKLGTAVKAGDVLAFVTPPFQAIDVSDMRQKAGELDQQIAIVEKRIARYEALSKVGAVAKVTLDEAVLELRGLKERRASLDKTRGEPERLIAPVSGIIAAGNAVAGQIAETNAVVFQIIDPTRLWVEALTFSLLPDAQPATARTGDGLKLTLAFQGAGLADRSQAIPVHFAIEGERKGLRVGQLVTVLAPTGEEVKGVAVPRTSIIRAANGQTVLFEHTAAERFEPRVLRVEPLDAESVLVLDGLQPGKRAVVQGAELLNQIR